MFVLVTVLVRLLRSHIYSNALREVKGVESELDRWGFRFTNPHISITICIYFVYMMCAYSCSYHVCLWQSLMSCLCIVSHCRSTNAADVAAHSDWVWAGLVGSRPTCGRRIASHHPRSSSPVTVAGDMISLMWRRWSRWRILFSKRRRRCVVQSKAYWTYWTVCE